MNITKEVYKRCNHFFSFKSVLYLRRRVVRDESKFSKEVIMNTNTRCDDDHMGHFFYNYMQKIRNEICQIDAATGEEETCGSVLSRSIRMSQIFTRLGLVPGDIVVVAGRTHLDLHIPFYAGMMSGLPIAGLDPKFKKDDLIHMLRIIRPKIAFCEHDYLEEYENAANELSEEINMKIVTFGGGQSSFEKLMDTYKDLPKEEDFRVATFNTDEVYCWLCSTSGTTGVPKIVALSHAMIKTVDFFSFDKPANGERREALNFSTLQWISGFFNALMMPINHIKLQTSADATTEHTIEIINKYKPVATMITPIRLAPILQNKKCDLTCFDIIKMAGCKMHSDTLKSLRARIREDAVIHLGWGQSEGVSLNTKIEKPYGNLGTFDSMYEAKLRDPNTGKDITEPNVVGELIVKGPMMSCYYNDPKATKAAFTNDGYYRTGDMFYNDENGLFYFVERLKMILKYNNHQVIPQEIEEVILKHPNVADVAVTGIPHPQDGDHIVACVVRRIGARVIAQEIKDLVALHLSDSNRLRGGVAFLDALPTTSTGKVARMKLKNLVLTAHRE